MSIDATTVSRIQNAASPETVSVTVKATTESGDSTTATAQIHLYYQVNEIAKKAMNAADFELSI